jgi:hypothetical protein
MVVEKGDQSIKVDIYVEVVEDGQTRDRICG